MLNFLKKNWAVIVVILLCFWAVKSLFVPGYFTAHDDEQIARIFVLDKAIKDGEIPVRWVSDLGFGFGYPLFNFYPPLSYYAADLFHLTGFSFIDSAKFIFILGFVLSSLFMYLWSKEHFGRLGGMFAAILYVYAPYHGVEVYVRGSLPDFAGYALFPLAFWLTDRLFKTKKVSYSIILGISLALIPLMHILNLLSFTPFFAIYVFYLLFVFRKEFKKIISLLSLSLLISLGLTAFFLIPSILEKSYTMVDKVNTGELYSYNLHFVYLRQFINSPWGYGGSIPGPDDGLSFEIGKIHLFSALLALSIFCYAFLKKKLLDFKVPILTFLCLLFSIYLISFYSGWIWDRVKLLSYLQFPWRFLSLTAVFSSFMGGFVIQFIEKHFGKSIALIFLVILGSAAIMLMIPDFKPQKYLNVSDNYYTNYGDISWRVSKSSFEFVPKGIATKLSDIKTTQVDLDRKDIPTSPYKILKGDTNVKVLSNKTVLKEFELNAENNSTIQFNTFSFPGWKAFLDGKSIQYKDNNKLKLITVDIPKGRHAFILKFGNTLPRAVGNAITLVTIFNLLGFAIFKLWKK